MAQDVTEQVPAIGTRWVWELGIPTSCEIIEVIAVKWNGEEWWIRTRSLLPNRSFPYPKDKLWNSLDRFKEACQQIGTERGKWESRIVDRGVERTWGDPGEAER